MLIQMLIGALISLLVVVFGWLPVVTSLPFGIDSFIVTGVGYVNFISTIFPPLGILYTAFLWVIGWKITLLVIRMIPVIRHMFIGKHT